MLLDDFQVRDFDHHWAGSYVEIDGKLAYVQRGDPREKRFFWSYLDENGRLLDETYGPMTLFEIWRPRSGFYNLPVGRGKKTSLYKLARYPRQTMKRGTDHRNTSIMKVNVEPKDSLIQYGRNEMGTGNVNLNFVFNPKYEVEDRESLKKDILDPLSSFEGVALSRKIAICRGDNNIPYVLCEGAVVGFVSPESVIKVFDAAECFKPMLEKQDLFFVESL